MKSRNFIYFIIAVAVGVATVWGAVLYLSPSKKEPADRVSANLADKVSANVREGCGGVSTGANASGAALDLRREADLPSDPRVVALKAEAQMAIDEGNLAQADILLSEVKTRQTQAFDTLAVNRADTSARCGKIALLQSQFADAAKHFAQAAAMLPPGEEHDRARLGYLHQEASALHSQGWQYGDNAALASAIARYKKLLELRPREGAASDWAQTQNDLGLALWRLGERESGTARLEEAVEADRAALTERTRERVPLQWAATQNSLGLALWRLGERQSDPARLEEAPHRTHP